MFDRGESTEVPAMVDPFGPAPPAVILLYWTISWLPKRAKSGM